MVGRLHPQKGHHFLIQAVPEIVRSFGEVAVVFAGGGELERELKEEVASLGLSRQVTFLGHVDRPGLLVGALDVAVMPSLYEGFSLSMLEFMAAGVPCVFSDHASFVEATDGGRTAVLVARQNVDGLARGDLRHSVQSRRSPQDGGRGAPNRARTILGRCPHSGAHVAVRPAARSARRAWTMRMTPRRLALLIAAVTLAACASSSDRPEGDALDGDAPSAALVERVI